MSNTINTTCILVAVIASLLTCGKTMAKEKVKSSLEKNLPFLQSEADRWSFENQMKTAMKDYVQNVEIKTKKILADRFLRLVWLPDYSLEINSKTPDGEIWNGTIYVKYGRCYDLSAINLSGDDVLVYENMTLTFTSDMKFWNQLKFIHAFDVSIGNHSYHGNIMVQKNDIHYLLTARLDFKTKRITIVDIQQKCIGGSQLKIVEMSEQYQRLSDDIRESVNLLYKGGRPYEGIETTIRTILEESFKNVEIREYLPKLDYDKNNIDDNVGLKGVKRCPSTQGKQGELELDMDINLPFINTEAEMWAFQHQMKVRLNEYLEQLINRASAHLVERELVRAKLPENQCLFDAKDPNNTKRYGLLSLTNGWISNIYRFVSKGIYRLEFRGKEIDFSTYVHLSDDLEFTHDYQANILNQENKGRVKGSLNKFVYLLEFHANLENGNAAFKKTTIDCIGELNTEIVNLNGNTSWMSTGIANGVLQIFNSSILTEAHKIIRQTFEYANAETSLKDHLPKWNYAREIAMELDERIEMEEDAIALCNGETISGAEEKLEEFSVSMTTDSTYKETPRNGEGGRPFHRITLVTQQPSSAITTINSQSWYLEVQMRKKMNEYLYQLLNKTSNIIRRQELEKAKMPDYGQPLMDEGEGNVFLNNNWVEDLSLVEESGLDAIEYNQTSLTLIGVIQIYRKIKFTSEYIANVRRKYEYKGKLQAVMPSLMFSLVIKADMKSKIATLQSLVLDCIGEIKVTFVGIGTQEISIEDMISEAVKNSLKNRVLVDVASILHHSFEDAILTVDFKEFLPEFDYERNYIEELDDKQKRFSSSLVICSSEDPSLPPYESLYKADENISPYEQILQEISTKALRSSFRRQIDSLMLRGMNSMWDDIINGSLQCYNPSKLKDNSSSFEIKDPKGSPHRLSLILTNGWNEGVMTAGHFQEGRLVFGANGTLNMLHLQKWKRMKVKYDFILTDHTEDIQMNGTIEAKAENITFLIKSRLDLHNKRFVVEEYFPHCIQLYCTEIDTWIRNPFLANLDNIEDVDIAKDDSIDLIAKELLKSQFWNKDLAEFWCNLVHAYPQIVERVLSAISPFVTMEVDADIHGASADYDWIVNNLRHKAWELFGRDAIASISNILYILLVDTADQFEACRFLPPWICYNSVYGTAVDDGKDEEGSINSVDKCDRRKYDFHSSLIRGNVPYVNSMTEWRTISRQTKIQMDIYTLKLMEETALFLRDYILENETLPDATRSYTEKNPTGMDLKVNLILKNGLIQNLSHLNHTEEFYIEFEGKEFVVTTYVSFNSDLKLSYQLEAITVEETTEERVDCTVKSLIFELKIRVNLERKSTNIEKFNLLCSGGLEIVIMEIGSKQHLLTESITEISRDIFIQILSNDIRKIMRVAFGYAVARVDVSEYIPEWNYEKDYGQTPTIEGDRKEVVECPEIKAVNQTTGRAVHFSEITTDPIWERFEEAVFFPD